MICLELYLPLQETADLEQVLAFLIFADGGAAARDRRAARAQARALEHRDRDRGLDQITWRIGAHGFDMTLSGSVPSSARSCPATCRPCCTAGRANRSCAGPCIPAAGACSMRSSAHSSCDRGRSRFRATCCVATATCLADHPLRARGHARERRSGPGCARLRPRPGDRACCSRCSGDWSRRTQPRPELMDSERVDLATFEACLKPRADQPHGPAPTASRSAGSSTAQGPRVAAARSDDIGSATGMLRRIAIWGEARIALDLGGRSQSSCDHDRGPVTPSTPVRYLTADVFELSSALRPDRDQLLVRSSSR